MIVGGCRVWRVGGCGAIMPRSLLSVPLAYSDFWELAGGGGQPAGGGKGEKGRKGKMSRDGGGVAEPMEGWQRVGRGGVIGENGLPLRPRWTSLWNARTRRGGMQAARPGLQPY